MLFPIGFDSFGLPAENYAIKTNTHPHIITEKNIRHFSEQLKQVGFSDLSESTLYPLLLRLEQQGKVTVERRPSPKGPSRKYYVVTEEGRRALLDFRQDWSQLCQLVEKIFKEEPDE